MGMFDSVLVKCPECNKDIEFQSKADECMCRTYSISNAPNSIKGDLHGETQICDTCGHYAEIETQCIMMVR